VLSLWSEVNKWIGHWGSLSLKYAMVFWWMGTSKDTLDAWFVGNFAPVLKKTCRLVLQGSPH